MWINLLFLIFLVKELSLRKDEKFPEYVFDLTYDRNQNFQDLIEKEMNKVTFAVVCVFNFVRK